MSAPKLFEFPTGEVIDLRQVFAITRLYTKALQSGPLAHFVGVYFTHCPDQQFEYCLSDSRDKAVEEKKALIERWAQDK